MNSSWLLATLVTAAMIFTTACDPENDTGLEVLPDEDLINGNFIDTFQVFLEPVLVDSVNTFDADRAMIGNYLDPEFGMISAEAYTQALLIGTNLSFSNNPANLQLDSLTLSLDLTGFYGRYDDILQVQVYEITEDFPDSDTIWSNDSLSVNNTLDLANGFEIDFKGLIGFKDFITIRLDDSLGRKLMLADPDSMIDNNVFTQFFKGLKIRTLPADPSLSREPGGIFYIDLESSNSNLTLYYRDSTERKNYTWAINNSAKRFHHISRTGYQSRLLEQIFQDTVLAEPPFSALQAGGLIKTYVRIPGLKNFPKNGINRAELVLPVDPEYFGSATRFAPPQQVLLYVTDSTGVNPENRLVFNSSANIDPQTNEYVIPLTNTMMQILDKRLPAEGFIILPGQQSSTINRAVLAGAGHPTLKPKLRVVLTTLPE